RPSAAPAGEPEPRVAPPPGRVRGVDLGSRRIGLALSDPLRVLAVPLTVLERTGDPAADHAGILRAAAENEAVLIVVGLPLSLSGGRAARRPGPPWRRWRRSGAGRRPSARRWGSRPETNG